MRTAYLANSFIILLLEIFTIMFELLLYVAQSSFDGIVCIGSSICTSEKAEIEGHLPSASGAIGLLPLLFIH